MSEWIINPKNNPPPEGVLVEIRGSDYMGDWYDEAMRVDYKKGSTKAQLKRKWRWIKDGVTYDDQAVDAYRFIEHE
jgi:hypothetical protein